jgi:hypothetical protein
LYYFGMAIIGIIALVWFGWWLINALFFTRY